MHMIGYIEGEVIHKSDRSLILKTGGIGYTLSATPDLVAKLALGEQAILWTHLAVKEDALDLYGFSSRDELGLFRLLIGISGIGPKSALGVLALADVKTLAHAIGSRDSGYLTKVSGIGKKLAEKIVLELKDKVGELTKGSDVSVEPFGVGCGAALGGKRRPAHLDLCAGDHRAVSILHSSFYGRSDSLGGCA